MTVNKITTAPTSNEVTDKINEIIDNIPTMPTVNNATLKITQGGTTKGTFTANASRDVTINLDAGCGSLSGLSDVTLTSPVSGQVLKYNGSNWVNANSYNRNIGEIVTSTIPLTDAGLHLLDGSLLQYGIYKEFIDYIADLYTENPDATYFCTETQWQTAVTTYGVCGKFVYDSTNNTVRLPKYSNKIYTKSINSSAPVVGNGTAIGVQASLGNETNRSSAGLISCSTDGYGRIGTNFNAYGTAVGSSYGETNSYNLTNSKAVGLTSNPTKSGIIAQLSDITTSLDGYYYIVIANSTKTDIQVDIDEIATDLNGKADVDLSNINASQSAKNEIISWGMPDYTARISIALPYTATQAGYVYAYSNVTQAVGKLYINGVEVWSHSFGSSWTGASTYHPVDIGDVVTGTNITSIYFDPLKGVN